MQNEHTQHGGEIDVPVEAIQIIDPAVVAKLPKGTVVNAITAHGASFWTRTARLDTKINGKAEEYFLKTCHGDRGRGMVSGEFASMSTMYAAMPTLVPRPLSWGTYETLPGVHFFLCAFHEMTGGGLPDAHVFPAQIAELHRSATSPNGKFGFPVTTYHGCVPVEHGWSDTWEEYFTRTTRALLDMEQAAQGPNEEMKRLAVPFLGKVVPRLLRPMETGGRRLRPCLVHGDLWHGNAAMDARSGQAMIFDAASFYGHNEYELGVWRQTWNEIGDAHIASYRKHFPISPPEEDHDDRNALYACRVNIVDSILYKGDTGYRERLIVEMRKLVDRFADGLDGMNGGKNSDASASP